MSPGMASYICVGKGGVGKSTFAVALAAFMSQHIGKTAIFDYDGGHSVGRALNARNVKYPGNQLVHTAYPGLSVGVVDKLKYTSLLPLKESGKTYADYTRQFPGAYGYVEFHDLMTLFGIASDISTVGKLVSLGELHRRATEEGIENIVIDVEPTDGFRNLITSAPLLTSRLYNLKNTNKGVLGLLGLKWPDISSFLKGEFMGSLDTYASRFLDTTNMLKAAKCSVVTIPEPSPVEQMFDVEKIIGGYGGLVGAYVINRIQTDGAGRPVSDLERSEIKRVKTHSQKMTKLYGAPVPVLEFPLDEDLRGGTANQRFKKLVECGERLHKMTTASLEGKLVELTTAAQLESSARWQEEDEIDIGSLTKGDIRKILAAKEALGPEAIDILSDFAEHYVRMQAFFISNDSLQ